MSRALGLVAVLVILCGAGAYAVRGMLSSDRGNEELITGLEDTAKGGAAKPMGADDVFESQKPAPAPKAGRPVEAASPARPAPGAAPAAPTQQQGPADPAVAARMAEIRAALHAVPVDKIAGADPAKVATMLAALEPVLEKDLAAHLAREAQRAKGPLDKEAESLYTRSQSFYNELPRLAASVSLGTASIRATERRGRGEGVYCTALPEGKIQRAVIGSQSVQWTVTFGLDPATSNVGNANGNRPPPFQGGDTTGRQGRRRRGGG